MKLKANGHVQAIGMSLVAFAISLAAIGIISGNTNASTVKTIAINPLELQSAVDERVVARGGRGVARPPTYSGGSWRKDRD